MDRLRKKNDLFIQLGALFGPLQHLAANSTLYDEQERAQTIARFCAEHSNLLNEFRAFTLSQPGHNYAIENFNFREAVGHMWAQIRRTPREKFGDLISKHLSEATAAIASIPVSGDSLILEAHTPFSTYCVLKDLCESDSTTDLVWVDPYLDANVFHRFLRGRQPAASVTLVTAEPPANASNRHKGRWAAFLDISRLYAAERDPQLYRLVVHPNIHDRWLRLDNKRLFSLGGSAKDAGNMHYFTLARLDCSDENARRIQAHIDAGTEWYGPGTPTHR